MPDTGLEKEARRHKFRIRRKKIKIRKISRYITLGGILLLALGISNRDLAIQGSGTDVYAYTGSGVPTDNIPYFADTILPAVNGQEGFALGSKDTFSPQTAGPGGYHIPKLSTMLLLGSLAVGLFGTAGIKRRFRV